MLRGMLDRMTMGRRRAVTLALEDVRWGESGEWYRGVGGVMKRNPSGERRAEKGGLVE